jgi:hypothetical protein
MANNHFLASYYRFGHNDLNSSVGAPALMGVQKSFPSAGVVISEITTPGGVVANGVTMHSIVEVLPTGLTIPGVPSQKWFSDATVATLNTAAT